MGEERSGFLLKEEDTIGELNSSRERLRKRPATVQHNAITRHVLNEGWVPLLL